MKALITGVTGQDGHYLADLLIEKGYRVFGIVRRTSQSPRVPEGVEMIEGDVTDASSVAAAVIQTAPDEVYHLAAQSHVHSSFACPASTFEINATGTVNMLEAVRLHAPQAKFYNAATSELFGASAPPQNEHTLMQPQSPYAVAKLAAYEMTKLYRKAYGLFACNGILFNHESPLRGDNFVTQKICLAAARIAAGKQEFLELGDLSAKRDWGHAEDYVRGMWLMLQHPEPGDYVLATGETHSVNEFLGEVFTYFGLEPGLHVRVNPAFIRPAEVPALRGDPGCAEKTLGWRRTFDFHGLVLDMCKAASRRVKDEHH